MRALDRRQMMLGMAAVGSAVIAPLRAHAKYVNKRVTGPGYVVPATRWLMQNYGDIITSKTAGSKFSPALLCAIAYQESGYFWWRTAFRKGKTADEVMSLIVLDDVAKRNAYPYDTTEFLYDSRFKDAAADLIAASNAGRLAQGMKPNNLLRFGYGLFQNDLQNIKVSPEFWLKTISTERGPVRGMWRDVGFCTDYCLRELNNKLEIAKGDVDFATQLYNGSGESAKNYLYNIKIYEKAIVEMVS